MAMPAAEPQPECQDASNKESNQSKDEDGWIRITSKSRRRIRNPQTSSSPSSTTDKTKSKTNTPHFSPRTPLPSNILSAENITSEYSRIRAQWTASPSSKNLTQILTSQNLPPISRAVCLGIGTFDPPDGGWEAKRRTFIQLVAFMSIVEELEKHTSPKKIDIIIQEPILSSPDKAFLGALGCRVVDSPAAFDAVTSDTLLFGVHLYRPVYARAFEACVPGIFVGTDVDVWDLVSMEKRDEDDLVNMRTLEKTHGKYAFPQDTSSTAFTSTSIYLRKSNEAGQEGTKSS